MTEKLQNLEKPEAQPKQKRKRERGVLRGTSITMSHGSGGKAMRTLIEEVFATAFHNEELEKMEDAAKFNLALFTARGDRLALTTDSYVVDPLFFPGGDIGKLAINGTVNDLAVSGAIPLYLTCGMIIEEGLPIDTLRTVVASMKEAAEEAGVKIVTGDTKVVGRGAADKLFINTAGVGVIPRTTNIGADRAIAGDVVIVNGHIGDHGAAIVGSRSDLSLQNNIESDCCSLNGLVQSMLAVCPDIHCMRDATRGGVASVLNEIAESSDVCVRINESAIPIRDNVKGLCEILGLDPLYLANEGTLVAVVPVSHAQAVLTAMKGQKYGGHSAIIGEVLPAPEGRVVLKTIFGGERVVDMLIGDQLPRIC